MEQTLAGALHTPQTSVPHPSLPWLLPLTLHPLQGGFWIQIPLIFTSVTGGESKLSQETLGLELSVIYRMRNNLLPQVHGQPQADRVEGQYMLARECWEKLAVSHHRI